jgi:hypothetical protein
MSEIAEKTGEQDLQDAISVAEERVDALLSEVNGLGARELEAQTAGDVDGVLAVRLRGEELSEVLRLTKADLCEAQANLEAYKAAQLADDPEQLTRVDHLNAEIKKLENERDAVRNEIDSKRRRRDTHTANQTELRQEVRMYRRNVGWG